MGENWFDFVNLKLVIVGELNVGKSALVARFVKDQVTPPTLGAAFLTRTVLLGDTPMLFEIWDTAGQERYHSLAPMYYHGAGAAIVVYSITDVTSFDRAKQWIEELLLRCGPDMVIALAGNTAADPSSKRVVKFEEAKSYAEKSGLIFMEVCTSTGMNIEDLFATVGYGYLHLARRRFTQQDLDLSYKRLTALPEYTEKLIHLTKLYLNHNKLTELPESIGVLVNLLYLFVNDNRLSLLPTSIKNLKNLQHLDLRNNNLKGPFKGIGDLKQLRKLYVEGNPLTLQVIKSLVELMDRKPGKLTIDIAGHEYLDLESRGFTLQDLDLSYKGLAALPEYTEKLIHLTKLYLNHNKLTELPESIGVLVNLLYLFVSDNRLSLLPTSIKNLKKLQHLDLRNNNLKGPFKGIGDLKQLRKLYVEGNPLTLQVIKSLVELMDRKPGKLTIDIAVVAPSEIITLGDTAKVLYEKALSDGVVNVYRGRILFIGQDRAGKTSLKKSLLGLPFDPKEQSTEGIEVDPSMCEIEVEQIKNWRSTRENKPGLSEFSKEISRMLAEKRYHAIFNADSGTEDEEERPAGDLMNQITVNDKVKETDISSPTKKLETGSDSVSVDTKTKFSLVVDTSTPSDEITKQADQCLKNMFLKGADAESSPSNAESIVTLDLWDFAGQHLYYASHPVFLSSRAVYILVHNLSKPLNALAKPCVRQGIHDVLLENPNNETNLENLLSWLVTVHTLKTTEEETMSNSEGKLPYLRPPVFIVGTHADKPFEDTKSMTSQIQQAISGKEYEKHVIRPLFSVDNTEKNISLFSWVKNVFGKQPQKSKEGQRDETDTTDASGIHALRTRIMEVLRQEPYMGERIPVRWFNFEKIIEALVAKNIYHMQLEQLQTYAKEVCFIEDDEEFNTMVDFYHNLGMIVKHRNTVVLKAQWLIDLFRQLITIPPFDKVDPVQSKYWQEVEQSGVLRIELVDHVFSRFLQQGIIKEDILDMMERFGLIAKFSVSPTDVKYFVPAQLTPSPKCLLQIEPSPCDPCPLYLHFVDGFVPHGLFSQLMSKSLSWCSATGCTQPPNLYQNGARFVIGAQSVHSFVLICKKRFIKMLLKRITHGSAASMSHSAEIARSVRLFVEGTLQDLARELPHLSGLRYKFCVACPSCLQEDHECDKHSQPSCVHEDCLHLLDIKQGERLLCMKSFVDEVLTVHGLEKWFPRSSQEESPSNVTGSSQDAPVYSFPDNFDEALNVTLLASEWSSRKGGLSTLNRCLAILLARHLGVEVTVLVPQFACSEEEKRSAKSYNIVIKEAERRPGYNDPLDWLSFPPKDLVIDIVVGHGGNLGKQAQVIRESHSCKWVQVVHTAPEELGMRKNYAKAICRGEDKNRTEVDLCKLANLVVAVGPKLTEAFSSYLRSCEKHQDIIQLTPGVFSEFSAWKQAANDSDTFKVLTFGRGDPEDFSLKGYDIAAKAVVELKDRTYRLVFVGAPDGKQEEVAENLLQSGISKDQLTVRKFVQGNERLMELFCEVDLAIMPSRTEGFGLTALEAMSAGLPILVSGNSGFGDALRVLPHGKPFVVESNEPSEWAKAIAAVRLKDRAQRLHEIQTLRTCYEETYSWEKQCEALVQKMWSLHHGKIN